MTTLTSSRLSLLATLASGLVFGLGLTWSTMIEPKSVLDFLRFYNFGLLFVLGTAVGLNLLVFQLVARWQQRPWWGESFQARPFRFCAKTALGGAIFGLGWGICGVCPGPALAGLGAGISDLWLALVGIILGAGLHGWWEGRQSQ